ncbi:uncharacterized protein EAF02_009473 [Botrytis sinoallii]|uniref:uncharacterized protein n=1 Tax=Botrytis sinoallii TaxID=1463999 RepID=UPI0018FF2CA2|nr:uncharacterized protein EAF02_009473 [Botrytis sinoallii]KAF7868737.1 hypothetical protein EAF02_009473 [Botrytis sinoallii]
MPEKEDSGHDKEPVFQNRNPPRAWMTSSEFIDMNDGKLLEHYLRTNNSTALQQIRPRLSGEGKVTTPMMVSDLGSSIDFLQAPRENPSLCGGCGSYLPLLYFRLNCVGTWCANCLRAFIRRESLAPTGQFEFGFGPAAKIFMKSDLDDRYRPQQSSDYQLPPL